MTKDAPKKPKPDITSVLVSRKMLDDLTLIRLAFGGRARDHLDRLAGEILGAEADSARKVLQKRYGKKG